MNFQYTIAKPHLPKNKDLVCKALPAEIAANLLLNAGCHVDHEGFDLNEIEQHYYAYNHVSLTKDATWYKDGEGKEGSNAVIYPWINQVENLNSNLIIDHSHIVIRYPVCQKALKQVKKYTSQRPELLRIISAQYKCGLDLCIDFIDKDASRVEPIIHIEWDYDSIDCLNPNKELVESYLVKTTWETLLPKILAYNKHARINKIEAFDQANTRAQLFFNLPNIKAYQLIPTL